MATDEALVVDLANGSEPALRELLRRYERPLSSFIFRHTGGRDVEDLFQETWLRVVRQADRFDRSKRFSTWLFQIAINLCRDFHRRAPQEPRPVPDDTGSSRGLERAEAAIDANGLLANLPEAQREVVILRFYHDLSEDQVAELLECPKGTVKSRLHHALARLTALSKERPDE
ncbi:MAG TPA: sigma-70 family RNA polymerase sigma factor [Candidatus Acidoferrales bacterium]|nr:sigma-70 family RNA polymerase sigma factor [Candidatus Acidoferrales bacterium]